MSISDSSFSLRGLRACLATSAHAADDDRIFFKEARSLRRVGVEVTILCAKGRPLPAAPSGVQFAFHEGGGGLGSRAVSIGAIERALENGHYDLVHCHEPDSLVAALRVKRRTGIRVIFDSHEMWSAVAAGKFPVPFQGAVAALYRHFERRWIAACEAAIGASWAITDYLASILGRDRTVTVLNVPVAELFGTFEERTWGRETVLCHDGHLTFDRGLKTMAEATRIAARRHPVSLKIVGDVFGPARQWLEGFIRRHKVEGIIRRTGWVDYAHVGRELAPCHIGLIALQKKPNNIPTSSNKVFNYMLYGIPFVGPDFRLAKIKLIHEEQCGVLADSASPESYAEAVCRMIEDRAGTLAMGQRAMLASRTKYRWEHMEPLLLNLYARVMGAPPAR